MSCCMTMHLTALDICEACHFPIPTELMVAEGQRIPCSEYHVRCVRCCWPVARSHISPEGLCVRCMDGSSRRNYYRRTETPQQKFKDFTERVVYGKRFKRPPRKDAKAQLHAEMDTPTTSSEPPVQRVVSSRAAKEEQIDGSFLALNTCG